MKLSKDILFSIEHAAIAAKNSGMGNSDREVAEIACGWFDYRSLNSNDLSERQWSRVCNLIAKVLV
jgi:hypothetical protein